MNSKMGQGFVLCWAAASVIALGAWLDADRAAVLAFTAPLWIMGVVRLAEGLLLNGYRIRGRAQTPRGG